MHPEILQAVTVISASISAVGAAAAAVIMAIQYRNQNRESRALQSRQNELRSVNNKILINQMWNQLNSIVLQDKDLCEYHARMQFKDIPTSDMKATYIAFCTINVIEVAWLLNQASDIDSSTASRLIEDMAEVLKCDIDAAERALCNRGYSDEFVRVLWGKIFPGKPTPTRAAS